MVVAMGGQPKHFAVFLRPVLGSITFWWVLDLQKAHRCLHYKDDLICCFGFVAVIQKRSFMPLFSSLGSSDYSAIVLSVPFYLVKTHYLQFWYHLYCQMFLLNHVQQCLEVHLSGVIIISRILVAMQCLVIIHHFHFLRCCLLQQALQLIPFLTQ